MVTGMAILVVATKTRSHEILKILRVFVLSWQSSGGCFVDDSPLDNMERPTSACRDARVTLLAD
jgi:hypothetical protein